MTKIAIFGGTFDPFHIGHLELLENVYEEIKPDRMIVIPAGRSYMKEVNGGHVTNAEDRVAMVRAGIAELSFDCELSRYEVDKEGLTYSIDTVMYLKSAYAAENPGDVSADNTVETELQGKSAGAGAEPEIWFMCGSDILFTIDKWYESEKLLKNIVLTVIPRGEDDPQKILARKRELEERSGARIFISGFHGKTISSSMIREDIARYADLIPKGTLEYIKEHHLYGA